MIYANGVANVILAKNLAIDDAIDNDHIAQTSVCLYDGFTGKMSICSFLYDLKI